MREEETDVPGPEASGPETSGMDRRRFLGTVGYGAGAALAASPLAACVRKPVEHILPYTKRPEDLVPGKPVYFATSFQVGRTVQGLLVESQDGRPTKVEGNPGHPGSLGAATAWAQASVWSLYDPDRATGPRKSGAEATWEEVDAFLAELHRRIDATGGEGLALLVQAAPSPTFQGLLAELRARYPKARVFRHDLMASDASRAGAAAVGAGGLAPGYDLTGAKVILTLDADVLGAEGDTVANSKAFAAGRDPDGEMNRLYAVEPGFSVTGGVADHRLRLKGKAVGAFLAALASKLESKGVRLPGGATVPAASAPQGPNVARWLDAVADDLAKHPGASAVIVGERQPAHVHALGHLVNAALGNVGKTVTWHPDADTPGAGDARDLAEAILAGRVSRLVVLGANPAYDGPADLDLASLLSQVPLTIHLGDLPDETAQRSTWHLPRAHYLESWGDLTTSRGVSSIRQPLIRPLHGRAFSDLELLARLGGNDASGHDLVRAHWKARTVLVSEEARQALRDAEAELAKKEKLLAELEEKRRLEETRPEGAPPAEKAPEGAAPPAEKPAGDAAGAADPGKPAETPEPSGVAAGAAAAAVAGAADGTGEVAEAAAGEAAPAAEGAAAPAVDLAASIGLAKMEVAAARGAADTARERVKNEESTQLPGFEKSWRRWVHDGVVDVAPTVVEPRFDGAGLASAWSAAVPVPEEGLEVDFVVDARIGDGRFANVPWLQELPDPVTKLAWDNAAVVSRGTAERLGVETGDLVHLVLGGRRLRIAVHVALGIADDAVIVALGSGRRTGLRIADGPGFDAGEIRTSSAPFIAGGAVVEPLRGGGPGSPPRKHPLASIQKYQDLKVNNYRRPLARVSTREGYLAKPDFVKAEEVMPPEKLHSLWEEPNERGGQQWGMSIDLNACTGCNACTIACQSENNIPTVGKAEVQNGRELHWIRLDRYFDGDDEEPEAIVQPMPCAQCENAPCEQVCPVAATTHSPDGLNDMAYNRCIGTRYCANNCPFKVRRFNYFNYTKRNDEAFGLLPAMQRNPDVTVRFRGVMEKCTYCVQRINEKKIVAKREGHGVVPDGAIKTACQETCPTDAIVFGDINDPGSRVSKLRANPRTYEPLAELNIHPRTTWLARIRNPNPALA